MSEYVAVRLENVAAFNAKVSGFLAESTEPDSEFFVDVNLTEQERIRRSIVEARGPLEYGPTTPDVLAIFILLSGDGSSRAGSLDELQQHFGQGCQPADVDLVEQVGLHPVAMQAISEDVVTPFLVSRRLGVQDLYLVYRTES